MAIRYKKVPGKLVASAALIALLGAGAAQLLTDNVADFEGYVPEGYLDPVGIPTKCFGDIRDVVVGQPYSFEECTRSLNEQLINHAGPILKCVEGLNEAPDEVKAASASMAYNIGVTGFCTSSVARYFNNGEWERGCRRMAEIYKTAKGKELPGLVKRRKTESDLCLKGLERGK